MLAQFTGPLHYKDVYLQIFQFKSEKIIIFHYWATFLTWINAQLFMAFKTTYLPCSLLTSLRCLPTYINSYLTWSFFLCNGY
jgi:hypothetical protein